MSNYYRFCSPFCRDGALFAQKIRIFHAKRMQIVWLPPSLNGSFVQQLNYSTVCHRHFVFLKFIFIYTFRNLRSRCKSACLHTYRNYCDNAVYTIRLLESDCQSYPSDSIPSAFRYNSFPIYMPFCFEVFSGKYIIPPFAPNLRETRLLCHDKSRIWNSRWGCWQAWGEIV